MIRIRFHGRGGHGGCRGKLPLIALLGILSSLAMLFFVGWKAVFIGTALVALGLVVDQLRCWLHKETHEA